MTTAEKEELVMLLEERTLSNFERRKKRLEAIPLKVVCEAFELIHRGMPVTLEHFVALNLGFLPGERGALEEKVNTAINEPGLRALG
jgi:hypothetical protein